MKKYLPLHTQYAITISIQTGKEWAIQLLPVPSNGQVHHHHPQAEKLGR